jgi:AAA15 family ATPase/GTPase
MFQDLTLQHFRGFKELRLAGLSRVNLIVGRNNAGKTSLLEAIRLLAMPERTGELPSLLRPAFGDPGKRFFRWLIQEQTKGGHALVTSGSREVYFRKLTKENEKHIQLPMVWEGGGGFQAFTNLSKQSIPCSVVSVQSRTQEQLVNLFASAVSKRGGEEKMDALFHEMDERIRKVRINPNEDGLHVMFDFDLSEMVPLSQVGQGVHRLLTIFSELIAGSAQICIIDEIENGIHHTMLEQLWQGIATAAENLNIQVFATTHSHECIEAAHAAFAKRDQYDLSVIQLFRVENAIQGRVLDRKHIEAAMAGEIDLR